jgi:hypothetical protein
MDSWDDLLGFIKGGKVIPVIGPDLLTVQVDGREVPLYAHLARLLAAELRVKPEELPAGFTLNQVVCQYLQSPGSSSAKIYLRLHSLLEKTPLSVPETLKKLALIKPFRLFVSTTFDSLLQKALNAERYSGADRTLVRVYAPNREIDKADLPRDHRNLPAAMVYHLFGQASEDPDYVVTEEDMLEFVSALQTEERRPNRLFDAMKGNHLLLIGNSFPDWLARFFVRLTRGERLSASTNNKIQYFADDQARQDQNLIFFLKNFGRAQLEIFDDLSPIEFVNQLADQWQARYPGEWGPADAAESAAAAEPAKTISPAPDSGDEDDDSAEMEYQSIFISYARENETAARRVADMLEEAGLSVWFDRVRIHHAEKWSRKIQRNIARCSLFLPILSSQTAGRREGVFLQEWLWAEQRAERMQPDEVFIVPVPIDNTPVADRFGHLHYEVFLEGKLAPEFVRWIKKTMLRIETRKRAA